MCNFSLLYFVEEDTRSSSEFKASKNINRVEEPFRWGCFPHTLQMGPRLSHLLALLILLVVSIVGVLMIDILILTCLWSFTSFSYNSIKESSGLNTQAIGFLISLSFYCT